MPEWLVRLMTVTYPVVLVCGSGLLAYWMKQRHERQRRVDQEHLEDLTAQVEALRTDLGLAIADVNERLDFTERLLARGTMPLSATEGKIPTLL